MEISVPLPLQMAFPAVKFCIERQRLVEAYTEAALRYRRLHSERIVAVIQGLEPPTSAEVVEAESKKEKAKIAVLAHQKEHGC